MRTLGRYLAAILLGCAAIVIVFTLTVAIASLLSVVL